MRSPALVRLLLATALLSPDGAAAAQQRAASLSVSVTVIRRVVIDVARAAPPPATARVRSGRLVFVDDAPPSVVVELRGEVPNAGELPSRGEARDGDRGNGPCASTP